MHHSHLSRPGYSPGEFPKVKFAPSGGSVVVENSAEERALGPAWSDNPPATAAAIADEPAPVKTKKKPAKKADDSAASE